ncbi:ATP synthase F0 subunit B [Fluviispira vulneris]|uniref:ATP synthase F0 subunit B n=1 Tax=Fluviispira vulneris TaxID=2763012 RepID=UPI0016480C45|nr:ATP synthase F0 subunit B [Fluviispira vulneris]
MAGSLDIYPFHDTEGAVRFGIQVAIFLVGVVVAQKLIIGPAIRLHNERKKRTIGSFESSKNRNEKAIQLEHEYFLELKNGAEEAKNLRAQEIQAAQKLAQKMISENQRKATLHVNSIREKLSMEMIEAKSNMPNQINDLVSAIYKKIGLTILLVMGASIAFFQKAASADVMDKTEIDWLYGVFWPYFQFGVFVFALVYFAKKPITAMLEKRRDDFKAKLSEAKEAALLAERKIKEYESKIASLQNEINELKERNLFDAKIEREKILAEAAKVSEAILRDAERAAKELIHRSQEEIRQELFILALEEVEKRLSPEKLLSLDSKLKSETIEGINSLN